jgi:molybdopterin synthase catalytic subunit
MFDIQLTGNVLSADDCTTFVMAPQAGGLVTFIGTVRNQTKGQKVIKLEFEAYEKMAISELTKIANSAIENYDIFKISIHHRVGSLEVGEIPVIIAVSAAHRKAAFDACQFAIDTLKKTVPIWKKEFFEDGQMWVSATP